MPALQCRPIVRGKWAVVKTHSKRPFKEKTVCGSQCQLPFETIKGRIKAALNLDPARVIQPVQAVILFTRPDKRRP